MDNSGSSALRSDISTEADVRTFVDGFYGKVLEDDLLRPIFVDLAAVNFDEHLPKMYTFWSSLLFGTGTYHGAPFPAHAALMPNLSHEHFNRWLTLFEATLNEHFEGPVTDMAKKRAQNIAGIFQFKLGIQPSTLE